MGYSYHFSFLELLKIVLFLTIFSRIGNDIYSLDYDRNLVHLKYNYPTCSDVRSPIIQVLFLKLKTITYFYKLCYLDAVRL